MIHYLYNVLLTLFLILAVPYILFRSFFQKQFRNEWTQRMGFFPPLRVKRPIWIHAASVGEVFCCIPLLKRIKKDFPFSEIVITTMTRTGLEAAKSQIPEAHEVLLFPIDHPFVIRRVIEKIQPRLLLIAETELWPNLLRSCGENAIPMVLFNGRISQKSFRGYLFLKSLFKECLKPVSTFLMQTEEDRNRIIEIGASPEKTKVAGNLKFDQSFPSVTPEGMVQKAKSFGLQGDEKVLIAGSTHSGEEEIILSLFTNLIEVDPHLILILAPRHLDRLGEVERILKRESISWRKRTAFTKNQNLTDRKESELPSVILLDTMGELTSLYSLGTLVFIGGSLVPVGGHNPLEPLLFKKCVLFGPYMFNFSEVSRGLIEAGGAIQVMGKEDLSLHLKCLLADAGVCKEIGEKGFQFLQQHRGATERVFEEIKPYLN